MLTTFDNIVITKAKLAAQEHILKNFGWKDRSGKPTVRTPPADNESIMKVAEAVLGPGYKPTLRTPLWDDYASPKGNGSGRDGVFITLAFLGIIKPWASGFNYAPRELIERADAVAA